MNEESRTVPAFCRASRRRDEMKVPEEVSVCGFDDLPQAQQVWPGLSTVAHPVDEIVERAIRMLISILAKREPESRQVVLPSRLVMRGSTAAPPPDLN